jgi:hydrogenase maturation protein HypF
VIRGLVQGVGFRPFVYRLARELDLVGWVCNSAQGVLIEIEGLSKNLAVFLDRIQGEKPPNASIHTLDHRLLDVFGYTAFDIRPSDETGVTTIPILPDIATCQDCLSEVFDPGDRRYRYPFTNCTHCGPRFSIVESLPYDRPNTSMSGFAMCAQCCAEYADPLDRRFHAQANACPVCGPSLELRDRRGHAIASGDDALIEAAKAIRSRAVVAVKGMGGFHLMANALDYKAVRTLRTRKHRDEKPFALMMQSLESVHRYCETSDVENDLLMSREAPIVLLRRRRPGRLPEAIAPGNPNLGVMLPYTPLHHLLLAELGIPIVATSGNFSDEPICIDGIEALKELGSVADLFLDHNRPIVCPIDDSVVRVVAGRPLVLRRARGYAPSPILLQGEWKDSPVTLAVGAHLKNTVAISRNSQTIVSQHIGDLSNTATFKNFKRTISCFEKLYGFKPDRVACDMHPDYLATAYGEGLHVPVVGVQHHYAHVLACMADNELDGPLLGVCWDGTGYGVDRTVWGGEFLQIQDRSFTRVAHLRTFRLPGGELAVKEPRRSAVGLLHEIFGDELFTMERLFPVRSFSKTEGDILQKVLTSGINAPVTSSAGRLFDAIGALMGFHQRSSFEGQAAMALEFATDGHESNRSYDFGIVTSDNGATIADWEPMVRAILEDLNVGLCAKEIAAGLHNTLVKIIVRMCEIAGEERVVLTGGCFQNRYLTEHAIVALRKSGFRPYWHRQIPPNDGGIAFGQIVAAHLND